jgi:DNA polymerase III epsilon subunit-like protein
MTTPDFGNLVVVDTETTGENPFIHEILSAAFLPIALEERLEVHVKVNDNASWTSYGRDLFSNFEEQWTADAVDAAEAVRRIEEFIQDNFQGEEINLVGHNVAFDRFFLARLASRAGATSIRGISHRTIDTYSLLTILQLLGRIPKSATSSSGAFSYFGIEVPKSQRHTAMGDAVATKQLFLRVLNELRISV